MSQKFIKSKNNNMRSNAFGKFFAKAVYDKAFIGTKQLAEFIQTQASVKRSDIIAVLDELGSAMKHFFELGQKVQLDGIGIFKVGFSSILFTPETTRVVTGQERRANGTVKQKYSIAKQLLKDVVFEEAHENTVPAEPAQGSGE